MRDRSRATALLSPLLAGCPASSSPDQGSSDSSAGASPCGDVYVPTELTDWEGPVRLQPAGSCDGPTTFADLDFELGSCGCSCGRLQPCNATMFAYPDGIIRGADVPGVDIEVHTCLPAPLVDQATFEIIPDPAPTCAEERAEDLPVPQWGSELSACAVALDDCVEQRCFAGSGESVCIYAEGDHDCTDPVFSARELKYRALTDSRECTGCGCATTEDFECQGGGGAFYARSEDDCTFGNPVPLECGAVAGDFVYLDVGLGPLCSASQVPEIAGSVEPSEPVTFCCTG